MSEYLHGAYGDSQANGNRVAVDAESAIVCLGTVVRPLAETHASSKAPFARAPNAAFAVTNTQHSAWQTPWVNSSRPWQALIFPMASLSFRLCSSRRRISRSAIRSWRYRRTSFARAVSVYRPCP